VGRQPNNTTIAHIASATNLTDVYYYVLYVDYLAHTVIDYLYVAANAACVSMGVGRFLRWLQRYPILKVLDATRVVARKSCKDPMGRGMAHMSKEAPKCPMYSIIAKE
jgi:hypothetical protein